MPTATPAEHEPAILDGMRADPAAFGVIDYSVFDRQGDGPRAARIGSCRGMMPILPSAVRVVTMLASPDQTVRSADTSST